MNHKFAKMFDTNIGQIVVIAQDTKAGDPELRFFFKPGALSVCTVALSFPGDGGEEERDVAFDITDAERAQQVVTGVLDELMSIGERDGQEPKH